MNFTYFSMYQYKMLKSILLWESFCFCLKLHPGLRCISGKQYGVWFKQALYYVQATLLA